MTTTEDKTLFGRPITGDVNPGETRYEQWEPEKFLPLLDALLDLPDVESVRWKQYTPYFNDGDPCTFSVTDAGVKVSGVDEEAGDYEDGYVYSWDSDLDGRDAVKEALRELDHSFRHFEDLLLQSFGDHVTVTATKEGFDLEEYSHD